jgi:quinol monooxygenase YgiN
MKVIAGHWRIKPEQRQAFIDLCLWIAPYSKQEAGYISYLFNENKSEPNRFLFFEEWKDQAAIDFHVEQPYFKEFMQKVQPMLAEKPQIKIYDVGAVKEIG